MLIIYHSFDEVTSHVNSANFVRDGAVITDAAAYCQGLYTGIGMIVHNILKHSPPWLDARIDIGKLRDCISVKDETGQRINPEEWPLRPDKNLLQARKKAASDWLAHKVKYESMIPFCAHKAVYPGSASSSELYGTIFIYETDSSTQEPAADRTESPTGNTFVKGLRVDDNN